VRPPDTAHGGVEVARHDYPPAWWGGLSRFSRHYELSVRLLRDGVAKGNVPDRRPSDPRGPPEARVERAVGIVPHEDHDSADRDCSRRCPSPSLPAHNVS